MTLADGAHHLYVLIKDTRKDLEDFLLSGRAEADEFHALSDEHEQSIADLCVRLGLTATYHNQAMDYMHRRFMVTYPKIRNPANAKSITLIPWFMLPGRPYPLFVYLYAIWHYGVSERKSLRLSALAAGKLFGIDELNKSTVWRSIKAMGCFIGATGIDRPLAVDARPAPSMEDILGLVPELLKDRPDPGSLRGMPGGTPGPLPAPVRQTEGAPLFWAASQRNTWE